MITEENLAEQFVQIANRINPSVGELLEQCHVRVLTGGKPPREWCYVGIYCPNRLHPLVMARKKLLRDIARHLDLVEVVCLNATNLVHDPQSTLREKEPSLWLELQWIVSREPEL